VSPNLSKQLEALMRVLIAFFIGIAATLAWQFYGNTAREMIANSSPQLSWLAPQDAVAQTASATTAPTASSHDSEEFKELSASLATLGQKVDQLAAQFAAAQEQMARDLTAKLRASEQDILDKISMPPPQPAPAPVRRPAPPPVQAAPAR
jgi:hypothetical protein